MKKQCKHTSLLLVLLLLSNFIVAQKQSNFWYFGKFAGLNFNTSPPTPVFDGQTDYDTPTRYWNEGTSSICDSAGALLFYSNGTTVWNRFHNIMPNGSGLLGHKSSTQACLIVPRPLSSQRFFVFTNDAQENNYTNGLRYSIVNMCFDGLNGDIVPEAKNISLTKKTSEKLVAVQHENGIDYWIITHKINSDAFYSFHLSPAGIVDSVISNTGTIDTEGVGAMAASSNGLNLAYTIPHASSEIGKLLLLDFDPATGIVSNERILSSGGREWGVSFSPDNSKLYCSTIGVGSVFQYNLLAGSLPSIIASKYTIIGFGPDSWRHHLLAQNDTIYISRTGKTFLSAITNPNAAGAMCNYIDSAQYLGGRLASFGLPNFIAGYRYQNGLVPTCFNDTQDNAIPDFIALYPNPASNQFTIQIESSEKNYSISILNTLGQPVYSSALNNSTTTIDVSTFPNGIYHAVLFQKNQYLTQKKVSIVKP